MSTLCRAFAFVAIFALSFGELLPWFVAQYRAKINEALPEHVERALNEMTPEQRAAVLADGIVTMQEIRQSAQENTDRTFGTIHVDADQQSCFRAMTVVSGPSK